MSKLLAFALFSMNKALFFAFSVMLFFFVELALLDEMQLKPLFFHLPSLIIVIFCTAIKVLDTREGDIEKSLLRWLVFPVRNLAKANNVEASTAMRSLFLLVVYFAFSSMVAYALSLIYAGRY